MRPLFGTRLSSDRPFSRGAGRCTQWVALICLLFVALASTAQAVHVHGAGLPGRTAQVAKQHAGTVAPDDSVCPLCVAMHSALPVAARHAVPPPRLVIAESAPWRLACVQETEHFAGFSRPPPAVSVLLG
ncbi:hypothetical protein [Bryocella elongata]|uniref:hypothetical protein n=1 Tax=Bryocella elongata TaxID=863522 RepID=UPI000CDE98C1|nr:hypothetical protein [Bryocella elongata]